MKKMVRTLLGLTLALVMSIFLVIPVCATEVVEFGSHTCSGYYVKDVKKYSFVNTDVHKVTLYRQMRCNTCGRDYLVLAPSGYDEGHSNYYNTYSSNHGAVNPAKHHYTKQKNCGLCQHAVEILSAGLTGCTSSGCREYQSLEPALMVE